MSEFDKWYENNPTSCDAKKSHIEGRIFALEWALDYEGGNCDWDKIESELDIMKKELSCKYMTEKEQTQISIKMSLDGIREQAKKEQYWNCIARTRSLLDLFCKEFDKILKDKPSPP